MSIPIRVHAVLAGASLIAAQSALAQPATTASAPVPSIIAAAQRVFISNAGSDSYASATYFPLGRYTGGPNRFYNQFYAAMKSWDRFALTDSPANADVVYEVRFVTPPGDASSRGRGDLTYDPQLNLSLLDPKTRVVLWSLTEHVAPARTASGDDRNFDIAVARIVARVKGLVAGDTAGMAIAEETASPELVAVARRASHIQRTAMGLLLGGAIGTFIGRPRTPGDCGTVANCRDEEHRSMRRVMTYTVSGAGVGALIGWLWPN